MKYIKSILAIILGSFATLMLLADIDVQIVAFCIIKLASLVTVVLCTKVIAGSQIINLDE